MKQIYQTILRGIEKAYQIAGQLVRDFEDEFLLDNDPAKIYEARKLGLKFQRPLTGLESKID